MTGQSSSAFRSQLEGRAAQFMKGYTAHRPLIQKALNTAFVLYVLQSTFKGLSARPAPRSSARKGKGKGKAGNDDSGRPPRVAVDAVFYQRLNSILKIVIPSIRSKEALLLFSHSCLLIFRTLISIYVAALDGTIVASLVRRQPKLFFLNILKWLIVAIPATLTNSWISFLQNKLAMAYRTRLTKEVMDQYLGTQADEGPEGKVYYKLSNLDDRIKNPDQMITHDIHRFSNHLSAMYSNLLKPVLDVIIYNYQLSQNVGAEGMIGLTVMVQLTAALLRYMTPPFGAYTALSAQLSGSLRHSHSRLSEFAEEIAFFGGEQTEKMLVEREYASLIRHDNQVLGKRWWHGVVEEGIIKWLWGSFGVSRLCGIPVFFKLPGVPAIDMGGRTKSFITNRRLLLSSSDAFGRVLYSYKDLSELAGYTARVHELLTVAHDIRDGKYKKALVASALTGESARVLLKGRGRVLESDDIKFTDVPIVTPNGDVLVKKLSFHVKPGADLWPVYGGVVRKPSADQFILIPQRPYLSLGTLRDQIIYPHSKKEMDAWGVTDDDLLSILAQVQMEGIVEREGGWDAAKEWRDALSGGDKQKIAWARLFYHHPKYAILDEATSLVPLEIEALMMQRAAQLGITLLTVSHRPSLWQYHNVILQYDGQGGYVFTKLDAEKRLALQEEKQSIETKLAEVPKFRARLAELRVLSGGRVPSSV
ncbi:ABC transporter transmembrane region 2-domain-containing protein [Schizophyllum amplum]|uniref:ABC transporter transmembrane region 2-domain-containing protein n=1 Tax=Schizophyllum amplum TaxID=97359 RepID=A0A550CMM1_9AGAR|nr:ABC transporter transmembrane region 2-domain-containing protein [Auriculariopsis ampla]